MKKIPTEIQDTWGKIQSRIALDGSYTDEAGVDSLEDRLRCELDVAARGFSTSTVCQRVLNQDGTCPGASKHIS